MPRRHSGSAAILAVLERVPNLKNLGAQLRRETTKDPATGSVSVEAPGPAESLSAPAPVAGSQMASRRARGRKLPTGAVSDGTPQRSFRTASAGA